jgi:SAM-dependent methyltransferase
MAASAPPATVAPFRVRSDDPEYRRMADAEAAYWEKGHAWSLEENEKHYRPGRTERYVNERFTGDPDTHWSETVARWGTFRRGLVLGTSSLKAETRLLATNPDLRVVFLDLSATAVGRRVQVLEERFPGRLSMATGDLNFVDLPPDTYDVVVSSSTMHHVTNLEHLAFQVNRTLTPGGYFFLEDYVGEARFRFADEKKRLFHIIYHRDLTTQKNRKPGLRWLDTRDLSPFCGVRSDEILGVFRTYLDEVQVRTAATLTGLIVRSIPADNVFRPPYWRIRLARLRKRFGMQSSDMLTPKLFRELTVVGDVATDAGVLRPGVAFAVYRKRG